MSIEDIISALKEPTAAPEVAVEIEVGGDPVEFVFRAIGKAAWADLLRDHPPTRGQVRAEAAQNGDGIKPGRSMLDHNPETLPSVAIAAACISHPMTVEQANQLRTKMASDAFDALWTGVRMANIGASDPKLRRVGSTQSVSDESDAQPITIESPEADFSDE